MQDISCTRGDSPGEDRMKSASKPAYPSTCSFPVKRARCLSGCFPCQVGEYWYHTAGGSVDPHVVPSRTYVHMCPRFVFPVPGARTLNGVSSALMLDADSTCAASAATRGANSSLLAATHCMRVVRLNLSP